MTENVALLLVDDRPENLVALDAVLTSPGIDLIKASSGNDALRHTLKQNFALVLLDVQMPGMDGFETAELMRSNPKTRHLPIIFITAGMKDIQLQFKGYDLGAVDYLIKPFEPQILLNKVKVFCELYRQRRQLESHQLLLESRIKERVAQLKASEERFRMLATHAPVGIYQIDVNGNCAYVNRRWCEIAGIEANEASGQGWRRTIHPDDQDAVASIWRDALKDDAEWSMDYRVVKPGGKIVWVHGNAVAMRNEQRQVIGYLGNNLEITERKRIEARQNNRSIVIGRLAEESATLAEVLHLIAVDAERQAPGMTCSILVFDATGKQLIYGAAPNQPNCVSSANETASPGPGADCVAMAKRGERLVVEDISANAACKDCLPQTSGDDRISCWCEPILAMNGDVLGVFAFYWPRRSAPDADDVQLMGEAAQLAGLAIERKRTENELQIAASVHHAVSDAIAVTDVDNRIIAINPAFTQVTGYTREETLGRNPRLLKSGRHDSSYYKEMWRALETTGRWQGEIWNRRKSGEVYPERLSINTIYDGNGKVMRRIAMFSDITEKKRTEETIWRQANYDSLTDLPNRRLFRDRLQHEILKAQRAGLYVGLLFVDLDRFKEVNDTLGHHNGDLLLIQAAHRVCDCVRSTDTVARLGGDEFTVIMSELNETDRVGKVAEAILQALAKPFELGVESVYVSASIGITIYPNDTDNVDSLLKNADQAMYAAKELGRNCFSYFTASMQETAQKRLLLSNDLRNAITAGQLEVHLQPIVELASGRIFKAEALLRWHHPTHGLVGPAYFIPIAEETGLISEIGDWVFKESARTAKRWYDAGVLNPDDDAIIQISVNKSPRQFFSGNTHETWLEHLKEIGLPPRCIAIEITEGLLLDDRPEVAAKLKAFRDAGFRVSLDDFGTGYSAMSYLKKFPLDFLKIDQSFVRDMASDPGDQAIVEAIIVMAHKLGLKVIAEGIETTEQLEMLKAAGCDFGQGYLIAMPMPASEMHLAN